MVGQCIITVAFYDMTLYTLKKVMYLTNVVSSLEGDIVSREVKVVLL